MRHRRCVLGRGRANGLRGRDRGGEAAQTGFPSFSIGSGRPGPRFLLWGGVGYEWKVYRTRPRVGPE